MGKALIISDETQLVMSVSELLKPVGHQLFSTDTLQDGWGIAGHERVDAVLLSERLRDGDGLALLPRLKQLPCSPEVIVMTGQGDAKQAEFALRNGAWDYLVLGEDLQPVAVSLDQALRYREEQGAEMPAVAVKREKIIGSSPKMKACLALLGQTAGSDASVLITGETGTGKELFARAIHSNSPRARSRPFGVPIPTSNPRADRNFVVVDCTALPETLVESVLFGHAKGAFTGADRDQDGLIAQADGGTLFLDEVGELPLATQKAFLRVLQERRYRPVGAKQERESNFRLIAATNRDLEEMVGQDVFRKDLLFRIRALSIELPPLRERPGDVKDLVRYHTKRLCESYGIPPKGFAIELLDAMTAYAWPGNVRELVNTLDGMLAVAGNEPTLYAKHLPLHMRIQVVCGNLDKKRKPPRAAGKADAMPSFKVYRHEIEIKYLRDLLDLAQGNIPKACEVSGISRSRLYEMLSKYGLTGQNGAASN
ncbi:MAG: sigma-54 dependent transcriptional regulator [Desulfosarcinaceae bacterium]